jgi:hypothetical protein
MDVFSIKNAGLGGKTASSGRFPEISNAYAGPTRQDAGPRGVQDKALNLKWFRG